MSAQDKEAERAQRIRDSVISRLDQLAAIPRLYATADVEDWRNADKGKRAAFEALLAQLGDVDAAMAMPRCAVLLGPPGTGKTRAAIAIGRLWSRAGREWRYVGFDDIGRRVRATYSREATQSERDVIDSLASPELVIIDDVGAAAVTEFARGLVHAVIDARYQAERSTVVITNLTLQELPDAIGERAVDRLRENGGTSIVFPGPSLRKSLTRQPREVAEVAWEQLDERMTYRILESQGRGFSC